MGPSLQVGLVGLDTSHVVAFTTMLNDPTHEYYLPGVKVISAYPGGSDLFSLSRNRVRGFTEDLTGKYGVTLYDSIESLVKDVDAIFLESVDGRQHLEQFRQMVIGKPVFIDKPFTTSTADARAIIRLATRPGRLSCPAPRSDTLRVFPTS